MIAAFVSSRNDCHFCEASHSAAAFCMYNRYVDGLATVTPTDPRTYDEMGRRMAHQGYVQRSR